MWNRGYDSLPLKLHSLLTDQCMQLLLLCLSLLRHRFQEVPRAYSLRTRLEIFTATKQPISNSHCNSSAVPSSSLSQPPEQQCQLSWWNFRQSFEMLPSLRNHQENIVNIIGWSGVQRNLGDDSHSIPCNPKGIPDIPDFQHPYTAWLTVWDHAWSVASRLRLVLHQTENHCSYHKVLTFQNMTIVGRLVAEEHWLTNWDSMLKCGTGFKVRVDQDFCVTRTETE